MSRKSSIKNLPVSVPLCWGELIPCQVSHMSLLLSMGLEESEYLLRFALYCAGLRPHGRCDDGKGGFLYCYYKRGVGNIRLSSAQLGSLAKAVRWVLGEVELMPTPELLPGWAAPDSRLYGVSLEQYMTAEVTFTAYLQTKDVSTLYPLVSALFVSAPYTEAKFDRQMNRAKALPRHQLEAVALWFVGLKSWLVKRYPYLFAPSDGDCGNKDGVQSFLDILASLNDGRIADNPAIRRADVHEALNQLNIKAQAAIESQKQK